MRIGRLPSFLKTAGRGPLLALLLILVAGAGLRWRAQPLHRVFFDEYSHLAIAQTLASTGRLCELRRGSADAPEVCALPAWPGGYHAALAGVFRLFGANEAAAFAFSKVLGSLSILLVFLAGLALWGEALPALFAAAFVAFSSVHLGFSAATETGLLSSFLIIVLVWAKAASAEGPLAAFAGWALLVRPENLLLAPLVPSRRVLLLIAVPALAAAAHAYHAAQGHLLLTNLALAPHFFETFLKNAYFWIDPRFNPPFAFPLFALGASSLLKSKEYRWLPAWFGAFFLLYALFAQPFGSPEHSRYALNLLPLYALIAGFGAARLAERFSAPKPLLLLAALWLPAPADPALREMNDRAEAGRRLMASTPADAYLLTSAPAYAAALSDRKAVLSGLESTLPLALCKDLAWYSGPRPTLKPKRLAIEREDLPEGPENYSLHLIEGR